MRKRALLKDSYIEIKNTIKRFLSILLIVLLGVGFFAGIKATSPDMKKTLDTYFDEQNVMDVEVIATLGLTSKDINSLKEIEGIQEVMPSYSKDAMVTIGEEEVVVKLHTIPNQTSYLNQLEVASGRLPEQDGECVVEEDFLMYTEKSIGDGITIKPEKVESEEKSFLKKNEMTIVGTVKSPLYISRERGSTKLGSGKINYYIYIPEACVQSDIYTEAYLIINTAKELDCYSSSYENLIKEKKDKIKEISNICKESRYGEIINETNEKLKESKEELEKKELEAKNQIADAKQKIKDAKEQIDRSEREIASNIKKVDSEFEKADKEMANAQEEIYQKSILLEQKEQEVKIQLTDAKKQLDTLNITLQQINIGIEQIQSNKTQIEDQKASLSKQVEQLNNEITNATTPEEKEEITKQLTKIKIEIKTLETTLQALQTKVEKLQQQRDTIENGIKTIEERIKTANLQLSNAWQQWNTGKQELENKKQELNSTKKSTYKQLDLVKNKVTQAKLEIEDNEIKIEEESKKADEQISDAQKQIKEATEKIADIEKPEWYILDRNQNAGYVSYSQDTDRIANIGKVFPVVFFVVAALISLTSMTRMVEEQRVQIGTLKALGYNKIQIASKYLMYAFLATMLGSLIGMIIGFRLLPEIIFNMYKMMYALPPVILEFNIQYAIAGLAIATLCTVGATIYSCTKELASNPATLMRPKSPKAGKRVLLERISFIWSKLNFTQKVTIRNIFRYKKRFLMTIIGICGCTALILAGFGLRDSIGNMIPAQYGKIFKYQMQTSFKDTTTKDQMNEQEKEIQNKNQVIDTIQLNMQAIKVQDSTQDVQLLVPKDVNYLSEFIQLKSRTGKETYTLKEDSIVITEKLANLLHINVGDIIQIKNQDDVQKEVKVGKITENYLSHYIYMNPILYEELFEENVSYNMILSKTENMTEEQEKALSAELLGNDIISSNGYNSVTSGIFDEVMDKMSFVVWILIVSAGLLAFAVLYNLSNVNISERIRELATIKVLGFYDNEVYEYVTRETVILTIIGIIVGAFAGYFLNMFVIKTCELDMFMFGKVISPWSYIYAASITALFAIIVNITTYFALKKINMVDSLKSVE